ncbi:hypothetical protein DAEQUDRAFT_720598 [Daedalea quercina L-15889]|uniref:Uncharacterized protein n=1 Tax=Daedalea quercina L-15889 TaxID=1314783 RepID=A0A165U5M5_9APHY|nr:hypothetical protein DAEQUDRAFT_720598 [Daedalea quercina L-15889]
MAYSSNSGILTAPPPYSPIAGSRGPRGSNEASPLLRPTNHYSNEPQSDSPSFATKSSTMLKWGRLLMFLVFLSWPVFIAGFAVQTHRLSQYPPTPAELDALRREFDEVKRELAVELTAHKQLQDYDKWAQDRLAFERERDQWLVVRRDYQLDQDNWEQHRLAYNADTESWQKALEEYELSRKHWVLEQAGWERERNRWALERERRDKEWREGARQFRFDHGKAMGLSWDHVESHHCVAHGTRAYTASLVLDAAKACEHMPIVINGALLGAPRECRRQGNTLVSTWDVNVGEASCKIYWDDLKDKGCVAPAKRRLEARLWGLDIEEDWMTICRSAPIDIRGQHFNGPLQCENRGMFDGMYGIWDIDDETCL